MARLSLAASAPPALVRAQSLRACHPAVQKGADRCVAGQQLVVTLSGGLANPPHPEARAPGGNIATLWPDMIPNPQGGRTDRRSVARLARWGRLACQHTWSGTP